MAHVLPEHPHLDHLRKQAKDLLRAHQRGDASVCTVLRRLAPLADASDATVLATPLALHDAQHALAKAYGFSAWHELKASVSEQRQPLDPDSYAIDAPAARASAVPSADGGVTLTPLPFYPRRVERVDGDGQVMRREYERTCRVIGELWNAMRMAGHDVMWEEVAAASGEAFRFTHEVHSAQDAEVITPVDACATACETLGFAYESLAGADLQTVRTAIAAALHAGRPVPAELRTRFWRTIVGIDTRTNEYLCIGGVPWDAWGGPVRAGLDEPVSPYVAPDACLRLAVPETDWFGWVLAPAQVERNPTYLIGDRRPVPARARAERTLTLALDINQPRTVERVNLANRQAMLDTCPCQGHDGWKFSAAPWPGRFTVGTVGIRAWAETIDAMPAPSDNFELIHGHDTTFGIQIWKTSAASAYLAWAADLFDGAAAASLRRASRLFREARQVDRSALGGGWRQCTDPDTLPPEQMNAAYIRAQMRARPALYYLLSGEMRDLMGEDAAGAKGSPWGYRYLPDRETFEAARAASVAALTRIADLRDEAFAEIAKAIGGAPAS